MHGRRGLRMMRAGGMIATLVSVAPAISQDTDVSIVQIPVTSVGKSPVEQVTRTRNDSDAAAQVGARADSRTTGAQLTREVANTRSPDQLYRGGRTAQPSDALSRPSEGRTSAVARVGGSDRCEGRQTNAAVARACARAIETRSGEFAATDAPGLSPEQRLLVDQRGREPSTSLRGAARRLADDADAQAVESQGIASVALRHTAPGAARSVQASTLEQSALTAETQAFVSALVSTITNAPPSPR